MLTWTASSATPADVSSYMANIKSKKPTPLAVPSPPRCGDARVAPKQLVPASAKQRVLNRHVTRVIFNFNPQRRIPSVGSPSMSTCKPCQRLGSHRTLGYWEQRARASWREQSLHAPRRILLVPFRSESAFYPLQPRFCGTFGTGQSDSFLP